MKGHILLFSLKRLQIQAKVLIFKLTDIDLKIGLYSMQQLIHEWLNTTQTVRDTLKWRIETRRCEWEELVEKYNTANGYINVLENDLIYFFYRRFLPVSLHFYFIYFVYCDLFIILHNNKNIQFQSFWRNNISRKKVFDSFYLYIVDIDTINILQ